MKQILIYLLLPIISLLPLPLHAYIYDSQKNRVGYTMLELKTIEDLSAALKKHFDATIAERMPKKILEDLRECKYEIYSIPGENLEAIRLYIGESKEVNEASLDVLMWAQDELGFDSRILYDAFIEYLKTKDIKNLEGIIESAILSFKESEIPKIKYSPDGRNPISWNWILESETRKNGLLHVGIDEVKRNFICYEAGMGMYFPEGETLERIYREIIQDPRAGEWLGKGRKEKFEREKIESEQKKTQK